MSERDGDTARCCGLSAHQIGINSPLRPLRLVLWHTAALRDGRRSTRGSTLGAGRYMIEPVMRILVVEDDKKIASFVVNGLKQSGYAVDHCADGEDALVLAGTTAFDAAVVVLMLPRL